MDNVGAFRQYLCKLFNLVPGEWWDIAHVRIRMQEEKIKILQAGEVPPPCKLPDAPK